MNTRELIRDARNHGPQFMAEQVSGILERGEMKPSDLSLKGLFQAFVTTRDGSEIVGDDVLEECCRPGATKLLAEAEVNTSMFVNISGQITFMAAMEALKSEEYVFTNAIPTRKTPFRKERIPGVTRIGDAALIVQEGKPYPTAGVTEDWMDTATTLKRGFIVPVTKEAIWFDRTGQVLKEAADLTSAFGLNKEKRAIDCVIDENTTAHRHNWRGTTYATYKTSGEWINSKTSNALVDWTDIDAVEQLFANMVDPNTGEPIEIMPNTLIVTPALEATAMRILDALGIAYHSQGFPTNAAANSTNAGNPVGRAGSKYSTRYRILSSRQLAARLATDTDWFLTNIEKGFEYAENWEITPATAPLNSELEFQNDIAMRFKISDMGAFNTLQPRATAKSAA